MTLKKALIISTLAIILTGITACAITYNKKTGKTLFKQQAVQSQAYNQVDNYNYTKDTWTISGQPQNYNVTFYENNGIPVITKLNYEIQYKQDQTLNITINITGLKYIDSESAYQEVNYTTQTTKTTSPYTNITELQLIQAMVKFEWRNNSTTILSVFYLKVTTTENTYNVQLSSLYTYNGIIYTDDVIGNYYTYDTVNIEQNIGLLTTTYETGYTTAEQGTEIVDVRGLMLNILTMPYTFISQAFNVTMWEGTPYAINLSNLILSLIAIATILFIIKLFTSGFSVIGNYTGGKANNRLDRQVKKSQIKVNESKANLNDRTKGK